jgi:hypothetical protein
MLAYPPGIAFTPLEACLLAFSWQKSQNRNPNGKNTDNHLIACEKLNSELKALARLLVIAEAIVFFDESVKHDASVRVT